VRKGLGGLSRRLPGKAIAFAVAALAGPFALAAVCGAQEPGAVAGMRALGATVEITVTSPQPFLVRALPPVLAIGDARFARSRYPADGSLQELTFVVPIEDFALLKDGDPMRIGYGHDPGAPGAGPGWDLGRLDKSRVGRAP